MEQYQRDAFLNVDCFSRLVNGAVLPPTSNPSPSPSPSPLPSLSEDFVEELANSNSKVQLEIKLETEKREDGGEQQDQEQVRQCFSSFLSIILSSPSPLSPFSLPPSPSPSPLPLLSLSHYCKIANTTTATSTTATTNPTTATANPTPDRYPLAHLCLFLSPSQRIQSRGRRIFVGIDLPERERWATNLQPLRKVSYFLWLHKVLVL
jgi:hypothetical protein